MDVPVEHESGRFVVRIDGAEAYLRYVERPGVLDVQSTYTPPALRGREIATRLTEAAIAYARARSLKIVPTCSYTERYLAARPELAALRADG